MSSFANFTYVTLVAAGGTPVRICNSDGAPYPTTGNGALVFSNGATLTNVTIDSLVFPDTIGLGNGSVAEPSLWFGSNDKGFSSSGATNITWGAQGSTILSVSANLARFYAGTYSTRIDIYSDTAGTMAMQNFNMAAVSYAPLLLQPAGSVVRVGSSVAAVSGGSVTDAAIQLTSGLQSLSVSSGAPTVSAARGSIAMRSDAPGAGLPYFSEGGPTWQQLVGVSATQTLTNKTIDGPTLIAPILGVATGTSVVVTGLLKSSGTAGVGYATGAGGTQTQGSGSGKATGVTLDKICGQITMDGANLNAGAYATFTLTNSTIATTDGVQVWIDSGGTASAYVAFVTAVGAGSCAITVQNITGGNLAEAPVIGFAVIKAVTA